MSIGRVKTFTFWTELIFGVFFLLDRWTKAKVLSGKLSGSWLGGFVSTQLTFNRGISFGMFHSAGPLVHKIMTGVIVAAVVGVWVYAVLRVRRKKNILGEIMVLAGAFGNLIDRLAYGAVVDFISIQVGSWSWPAFNMADVYVVVGVGLMLYHGLRDS